ncbi:hypothetical protein BS297_27385 [Rhodococcus erythropolis]|uniref:ABC transporter domain-containing protein n=1 Tax=Rhodococcus erythropolis TaxID=1833 RepID=A0A5N5DWP5_RHOER|nr:hypothetical protein BS297_27385 [Rhodococcus erythropolis]
MTFGAQIGRTLLEIEGLTVSFPGREGPMTVVDNLDLTIRAGTVTAVVGESGSGKSVTARALVGLAGEAASVSTRRFTVLDEDASNLTQRQWRSHRGKDIGLVLQDALTSLDPLRPVGKEIREALSAHRWGTRTSRAERVIEALDAAGFPDSINRQHARAGELSGGQRQRALIAQALALDPPILIADEPTTSLDVTVQAQILDLFLGLKDKGHGLLLISHDLGVVARLADTILVLKDGVVVEQGPALSVLTEPTHAYTKQLLAAVPDASRRRGLLVSSNGSEPIPLRSPSDDIAVEVSGLGKKYPSHGRGPDHTALQDVSFSVRSGTTLGIVGESGSGKSTLAWIVARLKAADTGSVRIFGEDYGTASTASSRRGHSIQVVYQDTLSSFDPRHSVEAVLTDALGVHGVPVSQRASRAAELLEQVGLLPERFAPCRPVELSGGQRQRLAIARALACEPHILILDEPVSALDASVQARVLDLLTVLQRKLGLTYLFVSHDLGVVNHMSDEVLVMKDGRVVESGSADDVLLRPEHPYTQELIAAVPTLPGRTVAVSTLSGGPA